MPTALPRLCAIVDEEVAARCGLDPVTLARILLEAGVGWLQLRAKHATGAVLLDWAVAIGVLARAHGAFLVVNDRADVARLSGAGVHVGQDDLPAAAARALVGTGPLVGLSTHTLEQARQALLEPISYLAVGPVFATRTKDTGYAPVGLELVRAVSRMPGSRPIVAIGGITLDRAPDLLAAGAHAVAVIGDLVAGHPAERARQWVARLS